MRTVRLAFEAFDPHEELRRFSQGREEAGGIVSFTGQVRAEAGDPVEALELRHFGPLTLPGMENLAMRAEARWPLLGVLVIHRVGVMVPGDPIVLVACAARHRRDSFQAADFLMDHLKSKAWFWKREKTADGWAWIEPRSVDHEDLSRWADVP
ncbi:molybdenum cofactor biosynthesis protein MoaE [Croceicoccus naphthovorans]|uniref:Molybdopterin synthase catalytic subunit n=1 Tax=Croceicoccus naphthovorans TaxID=1348774 RepID=A0A0G3XGC3_9SPHN|nr:molybdenum cofactor biosynthesis protein MoaE [Croceicoccus naphthovorans]AKM10545.1 molybdopterin converting factor [Croceicoccus naphthovorans]MBB3988744.1 molybdopterin synthase catalytic subunit [Croceicoccus naphthovorans]